MRPATDFQSRSIYPAEEGLLRLVFNQVTLVYDAHIAALPRSAPVSLLN